MTKKKNLFFTVCLLLAFPAFLHAQTAEIIEEMLDREALSYEQASWFVLRASDISNDNTPQAEAFKYAKDRKWLPKKAAGESIGSLEGVSLLIMRSFNIKGGLLYSLFKKPHYAYRELIYKDVIQGTADPEMAVSGEQLLFMVSQILVKWDVNEHVNRPVMEEPMIAVFEKKQPEPVEEPAPIPEEINTLIEEPEEPPVADTSPVIIEEITEEEITEEEITITLPSIHFAANSMELSQAERRKLQEIAEILKTVSKRKILVSGHTAMAGTEQNRLRISQQRASVVATYLAQLGARRLDEIYIQGFGAGRPIASNRTTRGMALNRRVEITILEDQ